MAKPITTLKITEVTHTTREATLEEENILLKLDLDAVHMAAAFLFNRPELVTMPTPELVDFFIAQRHSVQ